MSDKEKLPHEGKGSRWSFWAKLVFFMGVFLVVIFAILSSLGGNSQPLKEAAEQFLSQRFGGKARIETLNQMTFYPYMGIDFENAQVHRTDETAPIVSADKVSIAMGFWDVTFGTGRIKTLNVQGLRAVPGAMFRKGLTIDRLAVVDEGDEAFLRSNGKIGSTPYTFEADIEKFGKGKSREYAFADVRPFSASLGDLVARGRIEDIDSDVMRVNDIELGLGDPIITGMLQVFHGGEGRVTIQGELNFGEATIIKPDLLLEMNREVPKLSGDLVFETLDYDDALKYELLIDLIDTIKDELFDPENEEDLPGYDWSNLDIEAGVHVKELAQNGVGFASFKAPLKLEGGVLEYGPLESGFEGTDLQGQVRFDTTQKPAQFTKKMKAKNWDYAPFQKAFNDLSDVNGTANLVVDLETSGNNVDELKRNLGGHVSLIAGRADFPVGSLDLWGRGLVDTMLPGLAEETKAELNCAVADFEFESGIASTNALLLDTNLLTVQGDGDYDYPANELDINLEPKSKDVVLLDVSVPVTLSGPLGEPEISPSPLGIIKKLGGLSLGLVNPAFLAYSLTNLGLAKDHPCRPYIEDAQAQED